MIETISSVDMLFSEIAAMALGRSEFVIGIDGMNGVGKSKLGKKIDARLGVKRIELDCFLRTKQGAYVDNIRRSGVFKAMQSDMGWAVIEGVCFRHVEEKCGFCADMHIYVRRVGDNGIWYDEDICLARQPTDILKQKELEIQGISDGLTEELIDYHAKYQPVNKANVVFDIIE